MICWGEKKNFGQHSDAGRGVGVGVVGVGVGVGVEMLPFFIF